MRVLIVPDKFKGTLTAQEAARAIARGWRRMRPRDSLDLLPMSDGGDGFGRVISGLMGANRRTALAEDAVHRPRRAAWWWASNRRMAIVESATVIGLALLPNKAAHPFRRDTTGLGRLLAAVARQRPRRCFIGVGGSATNDGGFGFARALGWRFLDRSGKELRQWTDLASCAGLIPPDRRPNLGHIAVVVDVDNPLLGPSGCTRVYGPQKGLLPSEFAQAERCLRRLARLVRQARGRPLDIVPGAGAAGGLGFGLMAFLNAHPASGFELFSELTGLSRRIRRADLVITGEGCLDHQSSMGKGIGRVAAICREHGTPCIALAGILSTGFKTRSRFHEAYALAPDFVSKDAAMRQPALHLTRLAAHVASSRPWT